MRVQIGIDESGTGAWAGPFTLCGVLAYEKDLKILKKAGADDSKKLSAARREALLGPLLDVALAAWCEKVPPEKTFDPGQKASWRTAAVACVERLIPLLPPDIDEIRVVVDGNADERLRRRLKGVSPLIKGVQFRKQADAHIATVGAASIIAKTVRSRCMKELHKIYPEYGWDKNDGYGTPQHREAVEKHGVTEAHRFIKALDGMKKRKD